MKKNEFFDQYKDPQWQKKRLEILQRDEFMCQSCFDDKNMLNIHHLFYEENKKIWEYYNEDLITLCNVCHKIWHHLYFNNEFNCDQVNLVVQLFERLEQKSITKHYEKLKREGKFIEPTGINFLNE